MEKNKTKDPYTPTVYNIGYLGVGKYYTQENNVRSKMYNAWCKILERCYSSKLHDRKPSYKGVEICESWKNFQVFAEWYDSNYVEGFQIDKDLISPSSKIYSPETCCFVPSEINSIFTNRKSIDGILPIGVRKVKNSFLVRMRENNVKKYIGTFNNSEDAFLAYKVAKEKYIKKIADKWKGVISDKVYKAMYDYVVTPHGGND